MLEYFPATGRPHTLLSWLDSHHTFSFGSHHDPTRMGFRALRVINEDRVGGGVGFPTHGHRDMEILSWVLSGQLRHRDDMGNGSVIRPGELQRMTAGRGVLHSEMNASATEPVHFLQIWILPEGTGIAPGYEQKEFPAEGRANRLQLIGARGGRDGAITVHQDVSLYAADLAGGATVRHPLAKGRYAWVHVVRGAAQVNGRDLVAGDGLALSGEPAAEIVGAPDGEVLLFDLA